jgi:hypothetical protein
MILFSLVQIWSKNKECFLFLLNEFPTYLKTLIIDSKSIIHFYFYHFGTGFDSFLEYKN